MSKTVTTVPTLIMPQGSYADQLVGWWPTFVGEGRTIEDRSGYDRLATLVNAPPWTTIAGQPAVRYNDGVTNQYANIANRPAFSGFDDFTIAARVRFPVIATSAYVMSVYATTGNQRSWAIQQMNPGLQLILSANGSSFSSIPLTANDLVGVPLQLVVTRKGSSVTLYLDGVDSGSNTYAGTLFASTAPLRFTQRSDQTTSGTNLSMGEVILAHRAWTPGEVRDWSADPLAMVRPTRKSFLMLFSGGGPTVFTRAGSGGLSLAGAATLAPVFPKTGSGGLTLAGFAAVEPTFAASGSGGVILSGTADVSSDATFTRTGSGGILLAGTAERAFGTTITASGGLTLAGTADVSTNLTDAPVVTAAALQSGRTVVRVTFDRAVPNGNAAAGWTVTYGGSPIDVVSAARLNGDTQIDLTLTTAASTGPGTLAYTPPGS